MSDNKSENLNLEVKRVRVRTGIKGGQVATWPRVRDSLPWLNPPRVTDDVTSTSFEQL